MGGREASLTRGPAKPRELEPETTAWLKVPFWDRILLSRGANVGY